METKGPYGQKGPSNLPSVHHALIHEETNSTRTVEQGEPRTSLLFFLIKLFGLGQYSLCIYDSTLRRSREKSIPKRYSRLMVIYVLHGSREKWARFQVHGVLVSLSFFFFSAKFRVLWLECCCVRKPFDRASLKSVIPVTIFSLNETLPSVDSS